MGGFGNPQNAGPYTNGTVSTFVYKPYGNGQPGGELFPVPPGTPGSFQAQYIGTGANSSGNGEWKPIDTSVPCVTDTMTGCTFHVGNDNGTPVATHTLPGSTPQPGPTIIYQYGPGQYGFPDPNGSSNVYGLPTNSGGFTFNGQPFPNPGQGPIQPAQPFPNPMHGPYAPIIQGSAPPAQTTPTPNPPPTTGSSWWRF